MMRTRIGIAVLAAAAIGCSMGRGPATEEARALFEDDFSDAGSGWDVVEDKTEYYEGEYRIFVGEPSYDYWANPGRHFGGDVRIDVDVRKAGGPDDNNFGLQCRYSQDDGFDYYSLQISSDGYVWIARVDDGNATGISSEQMEPSEFVQQGEATNHLTAYCSGDQITLWVNGENVASATDSTYADGDVGLIAGTYETAGADIRFDDFTVTAD